MQIISSKKKGLMKKVDHRKSNLDKTSYQSLLEIELTEEQRKISKQIEEDTSTIKTGRGGI